MEDMQKQDFDQINKRFDEVLQDGQERERKHNQAHEQLAKQIDEISEQNKRQFQMLEPMYRIFTNVKGFNGISISILKGLILLGAAAGVLYGFIKWLKS